MLNRKVIGHHYILVLSNCIAKAYLKMTIIFTASYYGYVDIVDLLLNYKAEIDAKEENGWVPLIAGNTKL